MNGRNYRVMSLLLLLACAAPAILAQDEPLRSDESGPGELQLLHAEHEAYIKRLQPWRKWLRLIGRAVLLMIITAFLCIYVAYYNKRIITNHWRALGVVAVM